MSEYMDIYKNLLYMLSISIASNKDILYIKHYTSNTQTKDKRDRENGN